MVSLSERGSPAGEEGTLSLRGEGVAPCDLSLLSEVLLENTIILDVETPHLPGSRPG